MLAAILTTLVLIMLVSSVLVSSMQTANNSRVMLDAMRDRALLDEWGAVLRRAAKPLAAGGQMAVIVGSVHEVLDGATVTDRYHVLPTGIGGRRLSSAGLPLIYCPYAIAPVGVPSGAIETGTATSYNIESTVYDGSSYVTASAAHPDADVAAQKPAALVILPLPTAATRPQCEDVRYDAADGIFYLPGNTGMVESIRFLDSPSSVGSSGAGFTSYVAGDVSTFNSALMFSTAASSHYTAIEIPEGEVLTLTGDVTVSGATNQVIEIFSTGAGANIEASSARTLSISGVTLIIRNITLEDDVKLEVDAVRLFTDTVFLSAIELTNSDWRIDAVYAGGGSSIGALAIKATDSHLYSQGADISLAATAVAPDLLQLIDSDLTATGGSWMVTLAPNGDAFTLIGGSEFSAQGIGLVSNNLTAAGDAIWTIESAASMALEGVSMIINEDVNSLVKSQGDVVVRGGTVSGVGTINEALRIESGSLLLDSAVTVGSGGSTTIAVVVADAGANLYRGTNAHLHGVACWSGSAFASSASNTTGSSVALGTDYLKAINQSQWTCN